MIVLFFSFRTNAVVPHSSYFGYMYIANIFIPFTNKISHWLAVNLELIHLFIGKVKVKKGMKLSSTRSL